MTYQNKSKYEPITDEDGQTTGYEVYINGFDYEKFRPTNGWKKVREVKTEDEAKQLCIDVLPQKDDQ